MTERLIPFEVWKSHRAVKLHLTTDYDGYLYNFSVSGNIQSFEKRKDKYNYDKISREYVTKDKIIQYIYANLLHDPSLWIGKFSKENYLKLVYSLESIEYVLQQDILKLSKIKSSLSEILFSKESIPVIVTELLGSRISFTTGICLDTYTQFTKYMNYDKLPPVWKDTAFRISKSQRLLENYISRQKIANIIKDNIQLCSK